MLQPEPTVVFSWNYHHRHIWDLVEQDSSVGAKHLFTSKVSNFQHTDIKVLQATNVELHWEDSTHQLKQMERKNDRITQFMYIITLTTGDLQCLASNNTTRITYEFPELTHEEQFWAIDRPGKMPSRRIMRIIWKKLSKWLDNRVHLLFNSGLMTQSV